MENAPGFEVGDRALDRCAQPAHPGVEFLLPVEQFPELRLLDWRNIAGTLEDYLKPPLT